MFKFLKISINSEAPSELIELKYLLVSLIPCYINSKGQRYFDPLWYKDLLQHLEYIKYFTLASPCLNQEPPSGFVAIASHAQLEKISFIDLPAPKSFFDALRLLPVTIIQLWHAISKAEIVHTGIAGWPIPPGWLVTPIVKFQKKIYLIIVESAFWRLSPVVTKTFKGRIRAALSECINRWCINNTDLAIFTQDQYRKSLMTRHPERGHVIHASWISEENILTEQSAASIWLKKIALPVEEMRVLFAGRLTADKGLSVLLKAMQLLGQEKVAIKLDILGRGDLENECHTNSRRLQFPAEICILGTVSYGTEFFKLISNYHLVVVPSISDEQPRIVYDAYSQAVPVLASDTAGLRDCVFNGDTGLLVAPNQVQALAELLKWSTNHREELERMGMSALRVAQKMTHREMHRQRWQLLVEMITRI